MDLKQTLLSEKNVGHKGGIYNKLQVDMAFNSNHIEGSRLTHDQTRYIYETNTIGVGVSGSEEAVNVNDVIETVNHFRCFDFILDTLGKPLTEQYIKQLHMLLKSGVVDKNAVIGEFKYVSAVEAVSLLVFIFSLISGRTINRSSNNS